MSQAEWDNIQSKINAGYVEPASHGRLHSKNAEGFYVPYADTESEIDGSKHDLIDHLDFPDLNKKGSSEYLYVFLEPGGKTYSEARQQLGVSKYLIDRSVATSVSNFMSWDSANGLYNRVGYSINMGTDGTTDLTTLNNTFDSVYNSGGIYHLMMHPANVDWTPGQYADQHTDHIKGKKDVWYAGLGYLYLYNFTREKASRGVLASGKNIYLYYGKAGENNISNYNGTFAKDYGEQGLVGLWHMDETLGIEELTDGGLESWTNSTVLTNWPSDGVSAGVTDITQESTNKQAGSSSLKLTATNNTTATNFGVWQDISVANNQDYQVNLYQWYATHTATAGTLKIEAYDNTNSVSLGSQSITTTGTAFSYTSFRFTTGATTACVKIKVYLNAETNGIAYVDSISVKQSSKTLTDSSGNSNTGTINGASRTDNDGGQWGSRSNTIFSAGSALQFDGVDDYVDCGDGSTLNISSVFTIETWLNSNVISGYGYIVTRESGTSATGSGYSLYRGGNYLTFRVFDSSHNQVFIRTVIVANKTYHVVAVYTDGQIMLYLDGTLAGKTDITGFSPWFTKNLTIGKRSSADSFYFDGVIDEVRMYNRALSSDEILAQYQRRKFISLEPFTDFSVLHTPSNLYKGTINIISAANNYVTYSSDPVIDNLVNMRVTSSLGIAEVSINAWRISDDYYKKWTESGNTNDTTTSHVIGDLKPNTRYILMVNGQETDTYLSDPQGNISFDYSGSYSTRTFELVVPSSSFVAPSKPSVSNLDITTTNNNTLSLANLPTTITQIAISNNPDFTNSSWEDISKKDDLLKQYTNTDTLYIKFRTQEGGVSDTITYTKDSNTIQTNTNSTLQDGDLIKTPNNPDVYVIKYKNNKQYKRLLLSPSIFNSYLHLKWNNIKTISQQQSDQYQTSNLVKETTDTIIYQLFPNNDTGKRKPLNPSTSYDPDSIYEINKPERDSYELED